jgi:pimeloyl-ACP methyl ester carboxylesterase
MIRTLLGAVVLIAAGATLTAHQRSAAQPTGTFDGYWIGVGYIGVKELRIGIEIARAPDGPKVLFASLDRGSVERPGANIVIDGRQLKFDVPTIKGSFEGRLDETGRQLTGVWQQSGLTMPMKLERGDKSAAILKRPQDPVRPLPYDEVEVRFPNDEAGITLAGTLTVPRTTGPHPAALLISGSGPQDRNEEVYGHRPFLVIADDLTRRGIAVLRVDDRGVGGSRGTREAATSEDYAADALAAVGFLKSRQEIDPRRIGLIGHSEGGLVAPMTAARAREIAFIVLLAAPGLTGADIAVLQARTMLRAAGAPESAIETQTRIQTAMLKVLSETTDEATIRTRGREILRAELVRAGDLEATQLPAVERQLEPQIRRALTPWSRFFMIYDPRPALSRLRCPVLAMNGTTDAQVPAAENLSAIESALRTGGNPAVTIVSLPNLNHLFQTSTTGALSEYAKIEETFAPIALETMGRWITAQVRDRAVALFGR